MPFIVLVKDTIPYVFTPITFYIQSNITSQTERITIYTPFQHDD